MPSTLGVVASGEDVLNDAVLWLDASRSVAGENTMVNYGKGGSALNAQYGSTATSDTNDPLLLTHTGTNYLYLPGIASNYAATPSAAALDITGDIEIVLRLAAADWTPSATQVIASKRSTTLLSWQLALDASGAVVWSFNNGANLFTNGILTAPTPLTDATAYWLKFTRVASTGVISLQQAPDQATEPSTWPTSWTPSGTRSTGNITAQAVELAVGSGRGGSDIFAGSFYRCIVRNGIDGTTVFDANFTTGITSGGQTTFTESSANAATVTINRATSGRKSVAVVRPVLLFGTDDYLQITDSDLLDFGASDSFTFMFVGRAWNTIASGNHWITKRNVAGTNGYTLRATGGALSVSSLWDDGPDAVTPSAVAFAAGPTFVATGVLDRSATIARSYVNNTAGSTSSTSALGDISNSDPLYVGRTGDPLYGDFELLAVAVFRRVLSTNEIATVVARYA